MDNLEGIRPANILLVEDNPADQRLTLRAFNQGRIKTNINIVQDGQEAMDYLLSKGEFAEAGKFPFPDLVLLDINMPRMDGKQVLKEIRSNPQLSTLPVIILTTSDQERDVLESYQLGVNAYINKPVKMSDFMDLITKLEDFWLNLTILPPKKVRLNEG